MWVAECWVLPGHCMWVAEHGASPGALHAGVCHDERWASPEDCVRVSDERWALPGHRMRTHRAVLRMITAASKTAALSATPADGNQPGGTPVVTPRRRPEAPVAATASPTTAEEHWDALTANVLQLTWLLRVQPSSARYERLPAQG